MVRWMQTAKKGGKTPRMQLATRHARKSAGPGAQTGPRPTGSAIEEEDEEESAEDEKEETRGRKKRGNKRRKSEEG